MEKQLYWNPDIESLSKGELECLELAELKKELDYVYATSIFYKKKFDAAGFHPDDFISLNDLKKVPFTTKDELRQSQEEYGGLGAHQCAPYKSVVRIQGTSGTTGKSLYIGLTKNDVEVWNELFARHAWIGGIRPGDRFVNPCNFTLFAGGLSESVSAEAMGYGVIPAPISSTSMEKFMQIIKDLKPTVIMMSPSSAAFLAEQVRKILWIEPKELGYKKGFLAGEPLTEEVRRQIEAEWGIDARSFFGMSDVAVDMAAECEAKNGMHFVGQGLVYLEVIDPQTEQVLEMKDGVTGELVYTTLRRECTPVIRYRSRDMARVWTSTCSCGRTTSRIQIIGRSDDMIKVKGVNVFPSALQEVIASFIPETTGEMRIVLDKKPVGHTVGDNLVLKIEHGENVPDEDLDVLALRIAEKVRAILQINPIVKLVAPYTIPRSQYKADLYERLYEG